MPKEKPSMAVNFATDKNRDFQPSLAEMLPYLTATNDETILLRDGDLMASFVVDGIDATTADEVRVGELSGVISRLIAQEEENVAFYIHRISTITRPSLDTFDDDSFADYVDQKWQEELRSSGLRNRTIMITLVIRPSKIAGIFDFLSGSRDEKRREELSERAIKLDRLVGAFSSSMTSCNPRRLKISDGEWLGLLRSMISGFYAPIKPGIKFLPINDLIADTNVNFTEDLITLFGTGSRNMRFAAVMTLKEYPSTTYAGMFDTLNSDVDMVVTHSFTRVDNITARSFVERTKRQRTAGQDGAVSLTQELEVASDDLASGRIVFGHHHATVAVFGETESELDDAVARVTRVVTEVGGVIVREDSAAQSEYFAQHPGNFNSRTRPSMISSLNFAHMTALHGSSLGRPAERSPWGDAITILPTAYGEAYRFNFHLSGKKDERTVGHTIVLGQTGSGKTLSTAFLLAQAMRLKPRLIVFDKDRGFEMALRALGGNYSAVRMGEKTGFNPMVAENDERGSAWLTDWVTLLAQSNASELSAVQREAISHAVIGNQNADDSLQNFAMFRSQLQAVDDNGDLHTRLSRWDEHGQFGWLFSGKSEDSLSFENDIVGFDLTEIFDNDVVRTAWLSYIFRRIERAVEDERPTLVVLDEAWKLLDDPYFQSRLKDWMLTMRKKNVAVILLTQRVSHLTQSAAGDAILESAVTRLVFPSSHNTEKEIAPLNVTENAATFLQSSNVGNHLVLMQSGEDSVILNINLAALDGALGVIGGGAGEKASKGWRYKNEFWKEEV